MTDKIKLVVGIGTTDNTVPLGVEIWLNNTKFYDNEFVTGPAEVAHEFSDIEADHELKFVLKNKTSEHTKIDEDGNIVKDALIEIGNLMIDDIDITTVFCQKSKYSHNFNNTGPDTTQEFAGSMGCNGTVSLKFSSPVYLWLLENM